MQQQGGKKDIVYILAEPHVTGLFSGTHNHIPAVSQAKAYVTGVRGLWERKVKKKKEETKKVDRNGIKREEE